MLKKLALLVVSSLLCVLVLEVGLRLLGYRPIYEVYSKPSLFWQEDATLGWAHTPGARGTYVGPRPWPIEFETPIEINSLGLRGPEIEPLPPGGYRVMVQGDSRVVGFEVPYEDTFVARLEHLLRRELGFPVQMINAGVRAYGTDQSFLYYRERGREIRPDLVVLVHSYNDPLDNVTFHRMRRPFAKPAFRLASDGSLSLLGSPVPHYPICSAYRMSSSFERQRIDSLATRLLCSFQLNVSDHSALFTVVAHRMAQRPELLASLYKLAAPPVQELIDGGDGSPPRQRYEFELTTALVRAFAEVVQRDGAEFVFVAMALDKLDAPALEADGIRIIPRNDAFEGVPGDEIRFVNDSHFNARGHQLLAEYLAPALAEVIREDRARGAGRQALQTGL